MTYMFILKCALKLVEEIIKIYKLVFHMSNFYSHGHNSGNTDMDDK